MFTPYQKETLQEFLQDYINDYPENTPFINTLKEIVELLGKDEHRQRVEDDVCDLLYDNEDYKDLTAEQFNEIVRRVMNYDYSDYNAFIEDTIEQVYMEGK